MGLLPLAAAALTRVGAAWWCSREAASVTMTTSRAEERIRAICGTFIRSSFVLSVNSVASSADAYQVPLPSDFIYPSGGLHWRFLQPPKLDFGQSLEAIQF